MIRARPHTAPAPANACSPLCLQVLAPADVEQRRHFAAGDPCAARTFRSVGRFPARSECHTQHHLALLVSRLALQAIVARNATLFACSTTATDWFSERGFQEVGWARSPGAWCWCLAPRRAFVVPSKLPRAMPLAGIKRRPACCEESDVRPRPRLQGVLAEARRRGRHPPRRVPPRAVSSCH